MASLFPTSVDAKGTSLFDFKNRAETIITSAIDDAAVTIAVSDLSKFQTYGGIAWIGSEMIRYTALSAASGAGNLTGVTRGYGGTTAADHAANVPIQQRWGAEHINTALDAIIAIESVLTGATAFEHGLTINIPDADTGLTLNLAAGHTTNKFISFQQNGTEYGSIVLDAANDQVEFRDITLTAGSGANMLLEDDRELRFGTDSDGIWKYNSGTNQVEYSGVTLQTGATIIPNATRTLDLGSGTRYFDEAFISVWGGAFNVRAYGATGDGTTNDTTAFVNSLAAATAAGGGDVEVEPGNYLITPGSLVIDENVRLLLRPGAILKPSATTGKIIQLRPGGTIQGGRVDTTGVAFAGTVVDLDGTTGHNFSGVSKPTRVKDINFYGGLGAGTGYAIHAHANGAAGYVYGVLVEDVRIRGHEKGIFLEHDATAGDTQWVNGCTFDNVWGMYTVNFIHLKAPNNKNVDGHRFTNIDYQRMTESGTALTVETRYNRVDMHIWDWDAASGQAVTVSDGVFANIFRIGGVAKSFVTQGTGNNTWEFHANYELVVRTINGTGSLVRTEGDFRFENNKSILWYANDGTTQTQVLNVSAANHVSLASPTASGNVTLVARAASSLVQFYTGGTERGRFDTAGLDVKSGGILIGGTVLFESDRDLAVDLLPNADGTLDLGSASRRYNRVYSEGITFGNAANTSGDGILLTNPSQYAVTALTGGRLSLVYIDHANLDASGVTANSLFSAVEIHTDSETIDTAAGIRVINNGHSDNIYLAVNGKAGAVSSLPTGLGIDVNRNGVGENSTLHGGSGIQIWDWSTTDIGGSGPTGLFLRKRNNPDTQHQLLKLEANQHALMLYVDPTSGSYDPTDRLVRLSDLTGADVLYEIRPTGDHYWKAGLGTYFKMGAGNAGYVTGTSGNRLSLRGGSSGTEIKPNAGGSPIWYLTDGGAVEQAGNLTLFDETTITDGAILDSPSLVLRARYDSDPTVGVSASNYDATITHNITVGGASPAGQLDIAFAGTVVASVYSTGQFDTDGPFSIGGTTLFESDRDLAVSLIPNATRSLDLGSSTRYFDEAFIAVINGEVDVAAYATGGLGTLASPWTGWDATVTGAAAGATLRFRSGYFLAAAALSSAAAGLILKGEGRHTIVQKGAVGALLTLTGENVTIESLAFDGQALSYTGSGLVLSGNFWTLRDVRVWNVENLALDAPSGGFNFRVFGGEYATATDDAITVAIRLGNTTQLSKGILDHVVTNGGIISIVNVDNMAMTGCHTSNLVVGASAAKVRATGNRIANGAYAATLSVAGNSHTFLANAISGAVELVAGSNAIDWIGNVQATGFAFADNGTSNTVIRRKDGTGHIFLNEQVLIEDSPGHITLLSGNVRLENNTNVQFKDNAGSYFTTFTTSTGNNVSISTPSTSGSLIYGVANASGNHQFFANSVEIARFTNGGAFQLGGTTLFESDRDLAVSLLPNADNTLTAGSAARRFSAMDSVLFNVRAAASDANPTAQLSTTALKLGTNSADNLSVTLSAGAANRLDLATGDSFNIVSGVLQFGGTTLFESDRDLAVDLLPNADNMLDLGSASRRFTEAHAVTGLIGGLKLGVRNVSANDSYGTGDTTLAGTGGVGGITLDLPAATGSGRFIMGKKVDADAGAVTLDANGTDLIDGAATYALTAQYHAVILQDTASGVWSVF